MSEIERVEARIGRELTIDEVFRLMEACFVVGLENKLTDSQLVKAATGKEVC